MFSFVMNDCWSTCGTSTQGVSWLGCHLVLFLWGVVYQCPLLRRRWIEIMREWDQTSSGEDGMSCDWAETVPERWLQPFHGRRTKLFSTWQLPTLGVHMNHFCIKSLGPSAGVSSGQHWMSCAEWLVCMLFHSTAEARGSACVWSGWSGYWGSDVIILGELGLSTVEEEFWPLQWPLPVGGRLCWSRDHERDNLTCLYHSGCGHKIANVM